MGTGTPDVDALVAQLRARVEERRRQGSYPPGLEHALEGQARLLLYRRVHTPRPYDVEGPVARLHEIRPLSSLPAVDASSPGSVAHRLAAALTERQTQGIVEQVQAFMDPVAQTLTALAAAIEELTADVAALRPPLGAVLDRQAVEERIATQADGWRAAAAAGSE